MELASMSVEISLLGELEGGVDSNLAIEGEEEEDERLEVEDGDVGLSSLRKASNSCSAISSRVRMRGGGGEA